jgi:PAS domain S-box-containing protein
MKTRVDEAALTLSQLPAKWSVPGAWLAALVVYLLATQSGLVSDRAAVWITNLTWTGAALIAAAASRRAAQRVEGRSRTAWRLLAAASASWLIGQLIWDWKQLIRGVDLPFPSIADCFYIGFAVLVIAAMFAMRDPYAPRVPTPRHLGNLALICCSFAAAYITVILEPAVHTNRSAYFLTVALAESVTTAAAFVVAVHFLWSYRWGRLSTTLILIVASVAIQAAANLIYIRALIVEGFAATSLLSGAWLVAFGLQHWAAEEQVRVTRAPDAAGATVADAERWIEAVLPGFLLLLIVLALYAFRAQLSARVLALNALILGAFALILGAREVWLYLEERRLHQELADKRGELDRARGELESTLNELRETEERLRRAASAGNVGLWAWDLNDDTVYYSPEWKRQLGYQDHEISDDFEEWRSRVHPDDLERALATVRTFIEQPWSDYQLELRLRHKDGSYRWILAQASLRMENGKPVAMLGSHVDISRRKQMEEALRDSESRYRDLAGELEQRVSRRTEELRDAYQELESFAYAVSHDLKAPLRAMDGFSHLLLESSIGKLDPAEQSYLQRIRRGALQMDALIDGLLAYSRMERREMHAAPVDLPALIDSLLAEREEEIRERGVEVQVRVPPFIVRVDREGVSVVLRNLIENALKFTREQPNAAIGIEAQREGDKVLLSVKDNGIGFDERYHDQIFLIFQRLHREEQYRGTGIGLALARKAAQRMGGRLWAQSKPGAGAAFFLELPL